MSLQYELFPEIVEREQEQKRIEGFNLGTKLVVCILIPLFTLGFFLEYWFAL